MIGKSVGQKVDNKSLGRPAKHAIDRVYFDGSKLTAQRKKRKEKKNFSISNKQLNITEQINQNIILAFGFRIRINSVIMHCTPQEFQ